MSAGKVGLAKCEILGNNASAAEALGDTRIIQGEFAKVQRYTNKEPRQKDNRRERYREGALNVTAQGSRAERAVPR